MAAPASRCGRHVDRAYAEAVDGIRPHVRDQELYASTFLPSSAQTFLPVLLLPFNFYPGIGIAISAWFKALGTAHNLHRQYFTAKRMTDEQIAVFMEERKWDYRAFGFAAALLEGLPIIGLVFTVSNRVGAAMWAHGTSRDLF